MRDYLQHSRSIKPFIINSCVLIRFKENKFVSRMTDFLLSHVSEFLPPTTKLQESNVFTRICQEFCRGGEGGVHGEGGSVCGKGGVCMAKWVCMAKGGGYVVKGVICLWAVCMAGGMHGGGHALGACVAGGHAWHTCPPRPDTTRYGRSMRGRYASYWNAFLFHGFLLFVEVGNFVVQNCGRMRLP